MNPYTFIFLVLFAISAILHLVFCFLENEKFRKISKPFTIPFLTISLIFLVPEYPLIYLFPIFSWVGDILLIWKKKNILFFVAGTIAFICGHSMILIQMILMLIEADVFIPIAYFIVLGVFFLLVVALLYPLTGKKVGRVAMLGSFYMPYILFVGLFSVLLVGSIPGSTELLLTFIGYAFFFFSDAFLLFTTYIKDKKRRDFFIMSTYFLAEALITYGLALFILI